MFQSTFVMNTIICSTKHYKRCDKCGKKHLSDSIHKCNINAMSYHNHQISEKHDMVRMIKIQDTGKINYKDIIHWDLETFQEKERHVPYASGWYNGEAKQSYGKNCIDQTINEFITYENKTISAYNGAGFDFYFLLDSLTERGIEIDEMIISNGRLMSFRYGTNKVFDLCLFLTCKLEKACKDYKIKNQKFKFDHSKMKTWDDVEPIVLK